MTFKSFAASTAKVALAFFIACLALAAVIAGYDAFKSARAEREAKPLEAVLSWHSDLKQSLGLTFTARTKLVQGQMYVDLTADGYPRYLSDPVIGARNRTAHFTVSFYDSDGFKVTENEIQVGSFLRLIGSDDKPGGLNVQYDSPMGMERYKSISSMQIAWTVQTELPEASAGKANAGAPQDHCAPGLSKSERLKRLASHGEVRQTGYGDFTAGAHNVTFIDGEVLRCE